MQQVNTAPFRRVGIVANTSKQGAPVLLQLLYGALLQQGAQVCLDISTAALLNMSTHHPLEEAECIIAIGGDGTILRLVDFVVKRNIPIIGINLGRVGFLSEVEPADIQQAAADIMQGHYQLDQRGLLECTYQDKTALALNDVLFCKQHSSRTIEVRAMVGSQEIWHYTCDGVLVSTPTGSSAYSLSVGGPLVAPDVPAMLITPVAAHVLTARPILFPDHVCVRLELMNDHCNHAQVCADGEPLFSLLRKGDTVSIRKAKETLSFIRLGTMNYYDLVSRKLSE